MDKLRFILLFAVVLLAGNAAAYDFESGGLYYNILDADAKTVEVTSREGGQEWGSVSDYTGDIIIPASVIYDNTTYSVTKIGKYAFNRSSITSVRISNGVETIGDHAFQSCTSLLSIGFPASSLRTIEEYAFYDCYSNSQIILPEGLTTIGRDAFGYNNLNNKDKGIVELPSTLTSIGEFAFRGIGSFVKAISHIETPFEISQSVFASSESWNDQTQSYSYTRPSASLYVPINTKGAYQALDGWAMFNGIYEGEPQEITLSDGLRYQYVPSEQIASVIGYDESAYLNDLVIKSTVLINGTNYYVRSVGASAFQDRWGIQSLIIEEGIESIGGRAFGWCGNMKTISLPSTLNRIGSEAFYGCNALTSVVIPEGVQTIERHAFYNCNQLRKVELSSTITSIGEYAFGHLNSISAIISHIQSPFSININAFTYEYSWNSETQKYDVTPSAATLYVPVGTKASYEAIEGWTMFDGGIIEGDVREKTIDMLIYSYNESDHTAKVIGNEITDFIGKLTIPASVPINGDTYEIKSIASGAFNNCRYIDSLIISSGVESIGKTAFQECSNITYLDLPNTLKSVGYQAFQYCYDLKKLILPASLTSIDEWAFSFCGLNTVISHVETPFETSKSVFCTKWEYDENGNMVFYDYDATLYVPVGTKSAYETVSSWNMFTDIKEGDPKEETVDHIIYSYDVSDYTAKVIGSDFTDYIGKLTIPASVPINGETYVVKTIGSYAFSDNYYIDSLIISDGIEIIENNAFSHVERLRYIDLSSTLTSIGDRAFQNCYNLQKVILPESLTSIGNRAFMWCNALKSVVSRIKTPFEIDKSSFAKSDNYYDEEKGYWVEGYVKSDATLYVPLGTLSAYEAIEGWTMFNEIVEGEIKETTYNGLNYRYVEGKGEATVIAGDYSQITKLTIPGSIEVDGVSYVVKAIDNSVFSSCYSLDTLIIENGVERIGQNAFYNCSNMKSVSLPVSLKSIGDYSFADSYNITNLIIPEGVKTIGHNAFRWCSGIKLLELPSTLDSIGDYAFYRCSNLSRVVSRIKTPFKISKSVFCYEDYWENDAQVFRNSPATLYVPTGTKSAYEAYEGWNMFDGGIYEGDPKEGKSGIYSYIYMTDSKTATIVGVDDISQNKLEIPATAVIDGDSYKIIGIGNEVFSNKYLTSVIIPDGIETIGKRAFNQCYSLRSVKLPNTITIIGDYAFQNCNVLDTISIPTKIKSIGTSAFWGTKITEVKIPATTTFVGRNAFAYCEQLKSIVVDSENKVYDSRNNCNALIETAYNKLVQGCSTTVIPNSISEIGDQAFYGSSGLTNISIPNSIVKIGSAAFYSCRNLTTINIPSKVEYIGSEAFGFCSSLNSIRVDQNNSVYDSRNDCNAVIETQSNKLVFGCANTVVPRGVKILGQSAFRGINGLDSLKIPNGLEIIGYNVFDYSDIKHVEIPNSVKSIGSNVFWDCTKLTSIVSRIKDPSNVSTNSDAFYIGEQWVDGSLIILTDVATLYVPKGKKELYEKTSPWNNFRNIVEMDGDPLATPTLSYDGRFVNASSTDTDVDFYYSTDGSSPSIYYEGPIAVHDLGTVKVIAEKTFRSDSEAAAYEVKYLYDGDTLKLAEAGLMAEAIKWCGTDSVVKMTVIGPISTDEFSTISTLPNLKFLNLAEAQVDGASLPDGAFANSKIVSFVSPSSLSSVGSGIFRDCQQLAAVCWKASTALPADALSGVSNPNLLLYVNSEDQAPEGINNVVVDGKAKSITLTDATGNSNFYVPVGFHVTDTIKYTRNFQQKTQPGVSCGWETIVLPFTVKKITHETISNVTITPFADYYGADYQRPFWLYTLEQDDVRPAYGIDANVPYLICMPNADEYGDQYNLAGNVTFSAANVDIAVSKPIEEAQGDITFVPTYQSVQASTDVFTLNVNEEYKGYPAGSLFVSNFRAVRPFEAYSVHPTAAAKRVNEARMYTVSSLIGGNTGTTGIIDVMLKKNDGTNSDAVVKVYSLSGALIKQGKAEDVTNGLPKGVYVANGKKFVVK